MTFAESDEPAIELDPRRELEAAFDGRRWAEAKAESLAGTPAHEWPDAWSAAWDGELLLEPRADALAPEHVAVLRRHATDAARRHWKDVVRAERALADARRR